MSILESQSKKFQVMAQTLFNAPPVVHEVPEKHFIKSLQSKRALHPRGCEWMNRLEIEWSLKGRSGSFKGDIGGGVAVYERASVLPRANPEFSHTNTTFRNAATACRTATLLTSFAPIILATIGQVAVAVKMSGQAQALTGRRSALTSVALHRSHQAGGYVRLRDLHDW